MRITVHSFVSLDGVMQGPGGPEEDTSGGFARGGWLVPFAEDDWGRVVDRWFHSGEALLLGRRSFESMRDYWSRVRDPEDAVATAYNTRTKYLASTTVTEPGWDRTTVLDGDVVARVAQLKDQPGGELQVHGSWQLIQSLHAARLVDGYRILQFPVVLGEGKRLFDPPGLAATVRVTELEALPGGIVSLAADVIGYGATGAGEYPVPADGRGRRG